MRDGNLGAWTRRRVLVTGHSGFVGSWLATILVKLGADVTGFAASAEADTARRADWLSALGVKTVAGDVRDFVAVRDVMSGAEFDAVFHLAAQPLVSVGHAEPGLTMRTNVGGTINVLEAARLCPPGALVQVTSDKCYRNRGWSWPYREIDEMGGGCPYSVSKAAAEVVFESFASLYSGTPSAASVRFGNVIGGGDAAANRLVPDCVRALGEGVPIRLRQPDAIRPWQHVLDVVHGLLLLADALLAGRVSAGEVFNFAPPDEGATVDRLVRALISAWGSGAVERSAESIAEDVVLRLDGRKAATALGWRHFLDLDGGARWTVGWHRAVLGGDSPMTACVRQVDDFLSLIDQTRELRSV